MNSPLNQETHSNPSVSGGILGALINLAGRQRMLSQRIVLHAVLASHGHGGALEVAEQALAEFETAHAILVDGNDRFPGAFSDGLRQIFFGAKSADERIRKFIALAANTLKSQESDARSSEGIELLVDQATPLLGLLNEITLVYEDEVKRNAVVEGKRQSDVMERLKTISLQAHIVAFNARIVAARAGSAGREFSVVAAVLADIIKEMDQLVQAAVSGTSS